MGLLARAAVIGLLAAGCAESTKRLPPDLVRYTPLYYRTLESLPAGEAEALRDLVAAGRAQFEREFSPQSGLGAANEGGYNAASCAACHAHPTLGGSGDDAHANCMFPDPGQPGEDVVVSLRHRVGTAMEFPDGCPPGAQMRRAPPIYRRGWSLDPDQVRFVVEHAGTGKLTWADDETPNLTGTQLFSPDLETFVANAFPGELGVVTDPSVRGALEPPPGVPPAITAAEVRAVVAFLRYLDVPEDLPDDPDGDRALDEAGCAGCHRKDLTPAEPGQWTDNAMHVLDYYAQFQLRDKGESHGVNAGHVVTRSLQGAVFKRRAREPLGITSAFTTVEAYLRATHEKGEAAAATARYLGDGSLRRRVDRWFDR